ncbi:MAG: PLP-dependent aminotransferase family protein [Deltaproteobacteria bacterium]|nr:PLP-dependent aminotransferase family protein [Deltaproteobacteria bacterium]
MYRRVAQAIAVDIRCGRLPAGTVLPGTRRLAQTLGIHRNTALAAYRELAGEGFIDTRPGLGTFVVERQGTDEPTPLTAARHRVPRTAPYRLRTPSGALIRRRPHPPGTLVLSHLPAPSEVPGVALARAYRGALRRRADDVLDYAQRYDSGAPFGHPRLRRALAQMLARTRGLMATAEDVLVTTGSQMALYLVALALVEPGDVIAVEGLGYRPVWEAFRFAGAVVVPVGVDREGLCVEELRALTERTAVRAVYVTPHHQHPTGVTLTPPRRRALLELATAHDMAVIEDDYDCQFEYGGRTIRPLASIDPQGRVIYVGSLSKVLAPGLRIGYAVAPNSVLELMAERRCFIDRQGDHALACAVAEMIENGELRRHIGRLHATYRSRRDALAEALQSRLGGAIDFDVPEGGTAVWARVDTGIDVDRWHARAIEHGVVFEPGSSFSLSPGASAHARFGFAGLSVPQLQEAVRRLALALASAEG